MSDQVEKLKRELSAYKVGTFCFGFTTLLGVAALNWLGINRNNAEREAQQERNQFFQQSAKEIIVKPDSVLVGDQWQRNDQIDTVYRFTARDLRNANILQ